MKITTINQSPELNEIYVATGGYDANFAFFYKVVGLTAKSAKLMPIGSRVVKHGANCMDNGYVVADETVAPSGTRGGTKTCRIKYRSFGGKPVFKVGSGGFCEYAYKWGGEPIHTYNYH